MGCEHRGKVAELRAVFVEKLLSIELYYFKNIWFLEMAKDQLFDF